MCLKVDREYIRIEGVTPPVYLMRSGGGWFFIGSSSGSGRSESLSSRTPPRRCSNWNFPTSSAVNLCSRPAAWCPPVAIPPPSAPAQNPGRRHSAPVRAPTSGPCDTNVNVSARDKKIILWCAIVCANTAPGCAPDISLDPLEAVGFARFVKTSFLKTGPRFCDYGRAREWAETSWQLRNARNARESIHFYRLMLLHC